MITQKSQLTVVIKLVLKKKRTIVNGHAHTELNCYI